MATKRGRSVAGFFAGLFIISAIAFPAAVIYAMFQEKNTNNQSSTSNAKDKPVDPSQQLAGKPMAGFTPVASIPTLQKEDLTPGTGQTVKASDTITVDYTGALASSGLVFESSKDSGQKATFPLSGVIPGWTQGIPGMKVGGTRRLLIPASLAYGATGNQGIPPNSDLVFDVTVHSISK